MEEHHIPPAVSFRFEQIIALAAEHARLEPTEWVIRSHELKSQLEHRWREGIEMGLSTDAAEERAIELFGDPVAVGRRYQKPLEVNLLHSRAWQAARILLFLFVSFWPLQRIEIEAARVKATESAVAGLDEVLKQNRTLFGNEEQAKKQSPEAAARTMRIAAAKRSLLDHLSLWLDSIRNVLNLQRWVAAAAPFLIVLIARRTGTARFGHPASQVLLGVVLSCAAWVFSLEVFYLLGEMFQRFSIWSVPGTVFHLALCATGVLCIVAETIDLPSRKKWRILKLLGYKT
jgi:hypothetical protein